MKALESNIIKIYKDTGKLWLESLPQIINTISEKWHLKDIKLMSNLSYNYVACANNTKTNQNVVLKIGYSRQEIENEKNALVMYNGRSIVKLLNYDLYSNALLLEYVESSKTLKNLFQDDDEASVKIISNIMQNLYKAKIDKTVQIPTVSDWLKELYNYKTYSISENYFLKAQELATHLILTQDTQVLLHGDLHHDNILLNEYNDWLAIDPKGLLGEPAYELGAFIRNPIPALLNQTNAKKIIVKRIKLFSEILNLDKQRIKDWSYVQAVLCVCWASNNSKMQKYFIDFSQFIDELKL